MEDHNGFGRLMQGEQQRCGAWHAQRVEGRQQECDGDKTKKTNGAAALMFSASRPGDNAALRRQKRTTALIDTRVQLAVFPESRRPT